MKYSLAKHILTITIPDNLVGDFGAQSISIGGEGSYLDSITLTYNSQLWTTTGDATGSWVHDQNLDRTGTAEISIKQVSPSVGRFKTLCNLYFNSYIDYDGLTLELSDIAGNIIATCNDCYIQKIPNQAYQATSQNQTWTITCGKITIR